MGKTYSRKNGGLFITWERDKESWDGKKYSRLWVNADVQNPGDTSKMKNAYREIVKFVEDNNLTNVIGMHFTTSMGFGVYVLDKAKVANIIDVNDYSENHAAYEFAMNKVNELFGLDLA